jgi:SAM-dependent methyltransferase
MTVNAPKPSYLVNPHRLCCRFCGADLRFEFINLGTAPPTNAYLQPEALAERETYYPLRVLICDVCWLAQTADIIGHEELFSKDYAYFSSCSASWVEHARLYVNRAIKRYNLGPSSLAIEIAANDGYLLQHFLAEKIPCYGVEPTASTAAAARARGLTIYDDFFGRATAKRLLRERGPADLMVANNVLAHVPDINDFVEGFAELLKPDGVVTFEFPSLRKLIEQDHFDSIYHEHFSYLSLTSLLNIFPQNGLDIFDVETLSTHGGSLRVYAQRLDTRARKKEPPVEQMRQEEEAAGLKTVQFYQNLQLRADTIKYDLLEFLIKCKRENKSIVGYGAAAKGNTLLNYAGIKPDLLPCVYDASPLKQGRYLPGSRIPILPASEFQDIKPDYVLITPWNLIDEIVSTFPHIHSTGGSWVTAVPRLAVHSCVN